ncbi:MAG: sialidase family protein [Vicinamibacterales bacterium]
MRTPSLVPVLAVVLAAHAPAARTAPAVSSLLVTAVPSPAGSDSAQPQLTVSDRGVLLSWIEKAGTRATLKFAERTSSGWTDPRVAASGDDWFVNWADVPSVLRLADGSLTAHWLQKSAPDTYAYDVRLAYSTDEGQTWSASFTPHHDGTKTEHGFASLVPMPGAGLGLVWLDGRAMKPESHGHGGGAMSVRWATFDRTWKQTSEVLVDGRVCECCPTSAAVTADGPIAAFRDRSEQEVRDISVSRVENGQWNEPAPVHDDGWTIRACPVNGPALSAYGRHVAIAWFTVKEAQGRAYTAFSTDAGRTFGAPIRLDDAGSLGRVDVELLQDGSALATWIEFSDARAQFRARLLHPSGTASPAVTIAGIEGSRTSGYPRAARHGDELVFAWTESKDGRLRVQTATARVPAATESLD